MGFLDSGGQGAQSFADSFLKTYMGIAENKRAESASKIQQQMADAKLKEMADAEANKAAFKQYNTGFFNTPVQGQTPNPNAFNMMQPQQPQQSGLMQAINQPSLQGTSPLMGQQANPLGFLQEPVNNAPTIPQQFGNKYEAMVAQGKNPEEEYLKGAFSIISENDPEKGLELRQRFLSAKSSSELKDALMEIKKNYQEASINMREKQIDINNRSLEERTRNDTSRALIAAVSANRSREGQPDLKVYVDKNTGARHAIDLKNPSHKAWLAKYGSMLVPEGEAKDMEFGNTANNNDPLGLRKKK